VRHCCKPRPPPLPFSHPVQVARHLRASPPAALLRPCWRPWRGGALSLGAVVERLAALLPATFEELERDFAVGVVNAAGEHVLIDSGPLPEAVAASAAIPFVFSSVDVPGEAAADAGPPRPRRQRMRQGPRQPRTTS
jgi:predicted acylesterase/phospholipase RssA